MRRRISSILFILSFSTFSLLQYFLSMASGAPGRCILAIGDSHGASEAGWVAQLVRLRPDDRIINTCKSGNTIGFDNLDSEGLNTLKNIGTYIRTAKDSCGVGYIDDVIILLGTNDCKAIFSEQLGLVIPNLSLLLDSIRLMTAGQEALARIYLVTPPPFGPESMLAAKYDGARNRLFGLLPGYLSLALEKNCYFIDIYSELRSRIDQLTEDGVHLNAEGSHMIANRIDAFLDPFNIVSGDDARSAERNLALKEVDIVSSMDHTVQKAYHYRSTRVKPMPLIVRLHTWSGDYRQFDPLADEIIEKDWNYIFPDFRGANKTPKACGSAFAIQDIDDAIQYAIDQGGVDLANIHIIGASGGGYAALLMYMKSKFRINTFSAWVPISDLEAWYYQSSGRNSKYADDIRASVGTLGGKLNVEEARSRSPMYMKVPVEYRKDASIFLFAGIHDGYTGSVPISHTLEIYNKIVSELGAEKESDLIAKETMLNLISQRYWPEKAGAFVGDRAVCFQKSYPGVKLNIFEGGHEMLTNVALKFISTE